MAYLEMVSASIPGKSVAYVPSTKRTGKSRIEEEDSMDRIPGPVSA
ncbi:MAG TPA: hypothetical protein VHZ74_03880 [Bryobacteraceae bacterium]|nr:hypothetical protein [Bryobacteraceae bacterium]